MLPSSRAAQPRKVWVCRKLRWGAEPCLGRAAPMANEAARPARDPGSGSFWRGPGASALHYLPFGGEAVF